MLTYINKYHLKGLNIMKDPSPCKQKPALNDQICAGNFFMEYYLYWIVLLYLICRIKNHTWQAEQQTALHRLLFSVILNDVKIQEQVDSCCQK